MNAVPTLPVKPLMLNVLLKTDQLYNKLMNSSAPSRKLLLLFNKIYYNLIILFYLNPLTIIINFLTLIFSKPEHLVKLQQNKGMMIMKQAYDSAKTRQHEPDVCAPLRNACSALRQKANQKKLINKLNYYLWMTYMKQNLRKGYKSLIVFILC